MIKTILATLILSTSVHAASIDLLAYKDGGTGLTVLTQETVVKAWNAKTPACLKDGGKIMGVNAAFKSQGLKYGDCSQSEAKKRIHAARGFSVTVIKFAELPANMIKELSAAN